MDHELMVNGMKFKIDVDIAAGPSWGELKTVDVGLTDIYGEEYQNQLCQDE